MRSNRSDWPKVLTDLNGLSFVQDKSSTSFDQDMFSLFRLPLELRQRVYKYLLPSARTHDAFTFDHLLGSRTSKEVATTSSLNVVWERGQTSLLSVCRQMHDECASLLYGDSIFVVFIAYDSIKFRYKWFLPSGLTPSRHFDFLDLISPRYLRFIRQLSVTVDHVDSYTGMIKYNVGGKGLTYGLRDQVRKLVDALNATVNEQTQEAGSECPLNILRVTLLNGNDHLDYDKRNRVLMREDKIRGVEEVQIVLSPFADLHGIANVDIQGAVLPEYASSLRKSMS